MNTKMNPLQPIAPDALDYSPLLRAGDRIVCGQVCAEPLTLTRRLVAHCARSGLPVEVFIGAQFADTFDRAPSSMRFLSYGAIGRASVLADRGLLDVVSERYDRLPDLFEHGALGADVVLIQVAVDDTGRISPGLACDYLMQAARRARLVIAEVNPDVPWTHGAPWPADLRIDLFVQADAPPVTLPASGDDDTGRRIAAHVATIVPDGATLQVGVGSLPDAMLAGLSGHRHLGLHSGVLGDAGTALIECGALDNSRKGADAGLSVTNTVCGTQRAYRFAHRNPAVEVRHSRFTHSAASLAPQTRFHAINSALEVDLTGQVNSEALQGRQRGGIGGLLDFARAARACPGGHGITVLPATAAGGKVSRIVASLGGAPVTMGRSDVDVVVTEHGIAHLRDVPLGERVRRMIAIAAPEHREALAAQWHTLAKGGR